MYFRSRRKRAQDVSLSDYIETGAEGAALAFLDVVAGDDDMLESLDTRENVRRLRFSVEEALTEQERQVICLRYGILGHRPHRQREVADRMGISRSYISRIEKRALQKLRKALEGQ